MDRQMTNDLVLASGVVYFNEDFKALPQVVNALTTRSSTTDMLKTDATAIDKTLAKLLENGSEALLESTSSLSSVSIEFEASKAKVRDLRRRIAASMASLSGRRRDLNGLSFRRSQLETVLGLLQNIEICLRACHGPFSTPVGLDADALKKAQYIYSTQLKAKLDPHLANKIENRLEERKIGVSKLLRTQLLDSVSGRGSHDEDLINTLLRLQDLGELDEALLDALRPDIRKPPPTKQQSLSFVKTMDQVHCDFLSFPKIDSIEQIVGFVQALIDWGNLLMDRSIYFSSSLRSIQKQTSHSKDTWNAIQEKFEAELRPLLDAFTSSSFSSATDSNQRPRHYIRIKKQPVDSSVTSGGPKFKSSPYHLSFICEPLISFIRHHKQEEGESRLMKFLRETCETSLRSVVNRDVASLFELSLDSKPSEFVRSTTRLECVIQELRSRVLERIEICDHETLLLDVSNPYIHACRQRIDGAVDAQASALIARGGSRFVNMMRKDPLFLAIDARRKGDPPPNRQMLIEASFDHAQASFQETTEMTKPSNSELSLLVSLNCCLQRVAKCVLSRDEKNEFVSLADYSIFAARADIQLRVDYFLNRLREISCNKIDDEKNGILQVNQVIDQISSELRRMRLSFEFWAESSAVFDFLFLPMCYQICKTISRLIVSRFAMFSTLNQIFSLRSALAAALVDASDDPFGDLGMFDVLSLALRLTDKDSKEKEFDNFAAKELIKSKLLSSPHCRYLFSTDELNTM